MNKKGRKKVIPSYFQKSGDSLSSILQAGSYQRKIKQVLQKNKEFAKENQHLKVDLAHSTKSLQRCTSYNAHILAAKKKLEALVDVAQTFITGLKEVADFLDMKEYLFMTSSDENWRKLKLPAQDLEPIEEVNSSVCEEEDLSPVARERTPVVEPQRTQVTRSSKTPETRTCKTPETRTSKTLETRKSKTPVSNSPQTPKVVDTSSTSSLGTPVLCLSPLPVKRPLIEREQEVRPPKRSKTPEKAAKKPSPKAFKSLPNKKTKPFHKSPTKTPPTPSKKSPKLSKIPTRQKNPLPEPSIAFLPLSPPASRKTFVVRKEDGLSGDAISSRLRRETFKVPLIPIDDTEENTVEKVSSPRREAGNNKQPVTSAFSVMPNANFSDDMEITAMLPLPQLPAFQPCPLPPSDEMELTTVLPIQCILGTQSSTVSFPQSEPLRVSPEKRIVSEEVAVAGSSMQEENVPARKKSLRVKKSIVVKGTDLEADENCQPSSKRLSFDDALLNARRKSVQFSFNECYNAFQNIKTKADPPKSILKQPIQDNEPPKRKTPDPPKSTKSEVPKAPINCINISSSDDSTLTPNLPPDLYSEKPSKVVRNFSGVSERRSKKKTISGGDVFNEIQAFEENDPDCFAPMVPEGGKRSLRKSSESTKEKDDCVELKKATSSRNGTLEARVSKGRDTDSLVVSLPKSKSESPLKTSALKRKECVELEEPTSSKVAQKENEVSGETGSDTCAPPVQKSTKKPVLKISSANKKRKEITPTEEPMCSKDILSDLEVFKETNKDCNVASVGKGKRKPKVKSSTSNKKKSTELEAAITSDMSPDDSSKLPPAEPKKRVKKSKSKTQEDLEKVEVDVLNDPGRSGSFGRVRRHTETKSYKEPSMRAKMRRE